MWWLFHCSEHEESKYRLMVMYIYYHCSTIGLACVSDDYVELKGEQQRERYMSPH